MTSPRPQIRDLLLERLPPLEAERLASELTLLGVEPEFVRRLIDAGRDLPLERPPPRLRQDLRQIYSRLATTGAELEDQFRDLTLQLVLDTRQADELAGVRGSATSRSFSLVFESDVADLVLDVGPAGPHHTVDIQVLNRDPADPTVYQLSIDSGPPIAGDELGRISVPDLSPGTHRLEVENGVTRLSCDASL